MTRVFITGSANGLGRAAAQTLLDNGHEVIVHARSTERLAAVRDLLDRGAETVVGDLSDVEETREVADQVNLLGHLDAPSTPTRQHVGVDAEDLLARERGEVRLEVRLGEFGQRRERLLREGLA